jgi:hypothetical protein
MQRQPVYNPAFDFTDAEVPPTAQPLDGPRGRRPDDSHATAAWCLTCGLLCWLGLLFREEWTECSQCGIRLGSR